MEFPCLQAHGTVSAAHCVGPPLHCAAPPIPHVQTAQTTPNSGQRTPRMQHNLCLASLWWCHRDAANARNHPRHPPHVTPTRLHRPLASSPAGARHIPVSQVPNFQARVSDALEQRRLLHVEADVAGWWKSKAKGADPNDMGVMRIFLISYLSCTQSQTLSVERSESV
jgi:hypothetical protein